MRSPLVRCSLNILTVLGSPKTIRLQLPLSTFEANQKREIYSTVVGCNVKETPISCSKLAGKYELLPLFFRYFPFGLFNKPRFLLGKWRVVLEIPLCK